MTKVEIRIELAREIYVGYQREAERRGVTVESLVEQTVNGLLKELQREEEDGTDHPIIP